jgi:hypothetical protein
MLLKADVVRTAADADVQAKLVLARFYKVHVSGSVSISKHFDNLDVVSTSVMKTAIFTVPISVGFTLNSTPRLTSRSYSC